MIINTTLTSSEGDASHDDANATNADWLWIDNVTFNGNAFADLCVAIFPLVTRVALRNMKELNHNEMIGKLCKESNIKCKEDTAPICRFAHCQ